MTPPFKNIIGLLIKLLLLYLFCRLCFHLYHYKNYASLTTGNLVAAYGWGFKMDVCSVIICNFLFVSGYWFLCFRYPAKFMKPALSALFIISNALFIALNIFDIPYYNFTGHRSTADLMYVFSDSVQSWSGMLAHYWYFLTGFVIIVVLLYKWVHKILTTEHCQSNFFSLKNLTAAVIMAALVYFCFRVDNKKYINPTSPLTDIEPRHLALSQNSPFTFLYSVFRRQKQLEIKKYMPDKEAAQHYPLYQQNKVAVAARKKNIVVVILESFAREYITEGEKYRAHTPFLDSLLSKSTYFTNAFAQERSSNKGLVSILGSLPPVTDEPFYHAIYAGTYKEGIGHIFKKHGYQTSFFYGTEYDHFGFKRCMNMLGVQNYFSRSDYDPPGEYDGGLGIYDKPWLQFMAQQLTHTDTPFLSVVFTVSTHWPYNLPKDFVHRKDIQDETTAQQSVTYTDEALGDFFKRIKNQPWYNNTVFILCADHWFAPNNEFYDDIIRGYQIPIIIYDPSQEKALRNPTLASQLDVVPTIYAIAGINDTFSSFGKNLFDTTGKRYAMNHLYENGLFQILDNDYVLGFDANTNKSQYLYAYKTDSLRANNLLPFIPFASKKEELEKQIKAMLQQFNNAVLENRLTK